MPAVLKQSNPAGGMRPRLPTGAAASILTAKGRETAPTLLEFALAIGGNIQARVAAEFEFLSPQDRYGAVAEARRLRSRGPAPFDALAFLLLKSWRTK